MRKFIETFAVVMLAASLGWAQAPPDSPQPPEPPAQVIAGQESGNVTYQRVGPGGKVWVSKAGMSTAGPGMGMRGPGMGKWWKNPQLAKKLALTDDQVKKMESIFQNHRLQLIDLHANLEKQEVILEPMINAEQPDEQQTLAQIDKVAQARAELEKSNARMLFAIRKVLTPEQWKQLQAERIARPERHVRIFRGRTGGPGPELMPPPPPDPPSAPDE
jgi:Spy/CpxP family protein refolding chaperone